MKRKTLSELTLMDKFLFDEVMDCPEVHERACPKGYQMTRGQAVRERKLNIENHIKTPEINCFRCFNFGTPGGCTKR